MRRGLFIASDEVAAYTQSIFNDRIQKREAHLRWASEVTQTINVDQLLSKPKLSNEFTNSEVAAKSQPPRALVQVSGPMAEPPADSQASPMSAPIDFKATNNSLPTGILAASPPQPMGAPMMTSPRPAAGRPIAPPRPAAGMPPSAMTPAAMEPEEEEEEEHPSDGDGPTIQALPPMVDGMMSSARSGGMRGPALSEPPTLTPHHDLDQELPTVTPYSDQPTLMASPGARQAAGYGVPPAEHSSDRLPIEPEPDEQEEDQDETMVAMHGRAPAPRQASPLKAPPQFPVAPAAGSSRQPPSMQQPPPRLAATQQSPVAPPQRQPFLQTTPLGQGTPPPPPPKPYMQPQAMVPPGPQMDAFDPMQNPYDPMQGMPQAPLGHDNDFQRSASVPGDFIPRGQHPTGQSGEFMQPPPHMRVQPNQPRINMPTYEIGNTGHRTQNRYKRRPPMWVVAALSCSIALLIAGVVIAIASATSAPPKNANGAGSAGSPAPTIGSVGAGPFGSARADFIKATNVPTSMIPSTPAVPAGAGTAQPTAPADPVVPPTTTQGTTAANTATATTKPAAQNQPVAASQAIVVPPAASAKKPGAMGALTIVCTPKCDQIVDNGASLGGGHIFNRPVQSGRHTLGLSAPNGVKKNLVVEVVPEQTREVKISMDR